MKRAVHEYAGSQYQPLLRWAGCEYGDLEKLVTRDGVEGTLQALFRQGVYLTVDEFKGRRPVIRRPVTIAVDPNRLRSLGRNSTCQPNQAGAEKRGVRYSYRVSSAIATSARARTQRRRR